MGFLSISNHNFYDKTKEGRQISRRPAGSWIELAARGHFVLPLFLELFSFRFFDADGPGGMAGLGLFGVPQLIRAAILLPGVVIGLVAAGAGFATPLLLKNVFEKKNNPEEEKLQQGPKLAFIPFDSAVVNVNEANLARFLRVKLIFVVDEAQEIQITELIQKNKAILKNWLIGHLSDKNMLDVTGAAGIHRTRREILDQFNTLLFPDGSEKIRDILFEEFNVQ